MTASARGGLNRPCVAVSSLRCVRMHGQGIAEFVNGGKYTGEMADGEMTGVGAYTWSNGTRFEGSFDRNAVRDPTSFPCDQRAADCRCRR